jgi:hypothetical protein
MYKTTLNAPRALPTPRPLLGPEPPPVTATQPAPPAKKRRAFTKPCDVTATQCPALHHYGWRGTLKQLADSRTVMHRRATLAERQFAERERGYKAEIAALRKQLAALTAETKQQASDAAQEKTTDEKVKQEA